MDEHNAQPSSTSSITDEDTETIENEHYESNQDDVCYFFVYILW
jgi:hypothetical protein